LQLRDEEIQRLTSELQMIHPHLHRISVHFSQEQSVCEHHISDHNQSIAELPLDISALPFSLSVCHTHSIIALHKRHRKSLNKVRTGDEITLVERLLRVSPLSAFDVLPPPPSSAECNKRLVQSKLARVRERIASARERAELTEVEIRHLNAEVGAAPDARSAEESIAVARADYLAAETRRRTEDWAAVDELRVCSPAHWEAEETRP
jgi:hypothetical protein